MSDGARRLSLVRLVSVCGVLLIGARSAWPQETTIAGRVTDDLGQPRGEADHRHATLPELALDPVAVAEGPVEALKGTGQMCLSGEVTSSKLLRGPDCGETILVP